MADKKIVDKSVKSDKDCDLFLTEGEQNPYLEKEEAYYKLNIELQKKTSEIFEKIENYSKSRYNLNLVQDAGDSCSLSDSDSNEGEHDKNVNTKCINGTRGFCSEERLHTAKSVHTTTGTMKHSELPTASSRSKSFSVCSDSLHAFGPQQEMTSHQNRLQKATESVVKCLQSKLVNNESRLADLHLQFRQKIQENTMLESKVKALEEERERLLRNTANLQSCVEKHTKVADVSKSNLVIKNNAITSMKREMDELKREIRSSNGQIQSLQTRLHRSTEENERLKSQNKSVHLHLKEMQSEGRSKVDEQNQRIVQLEQQKSLLSATVSKHALTIKTLREHKVNIESILTENRISIPDPQYFHLCENDAQCNST